MKTKKQKILEYNAVFQQEDEGGYSVWIPDLPGCTSQGDTFEQALKNIKEAIELYLEDKTDVDDDIYSKKQFVVPVQINYA